MASSPLEARRARLLTGPVAPTLFALSWPMAVGLFAVIAINVTDTFYLGRLGPDQLSAIGYCFPVIFGLSAVSVGMGNGAAAVVSRALGAGEADRARMLTANTGLFVLLCAVLLAGLMLVASDTVFSSWLGTPDRLMVHVRAYMHVWYLGLPFLILPIVLNGLVRASGETFVPSALMVLAAAINAGLSPLLVFGLAGLPAMGMAGAAWATIAARGVIAAMAVAYLWRQDLIAVNAKVLRGFPACVREVLGYGGPAFLAQLASPVGTGVVTRLLSEEGPEVVGAFAVGARMEALALIPLFALQSGVAPLIGQNVGAGRLDRLRRTERVLAGFALGWGVLVGAALFASGGDLGALFTDDPAIAALTDHYLEVTCWGYVGAGMLFLAIGVFNPLGYPNLAMALNVSRYLVLYAGLAAVAASGVVPWFSGVGGIFAAAPVSFALAGLLSAGLVHVLLDHPRRTGAPRAPAGPRPIPRASV